MSLYILVPKFIKKKVKDVAYKYQEINFITGVVYSKVIEKKKRFPSMTNE
jgi:hypothetical protein